MNIRHSRNCCGCVETCRWRWNITILFVFRLSKQERRTDKSGILPLPVIHRASPKSKLFLFTATEEWFLQIFYDLRHEVVELKINWRVYRFFMWINLSIQLFTGADAICFLPCVSRGIDSALPNNGTLGGPGIRSIVLTYEELSHFR